MQVTRLGRHTALTFRVSQGATLSVCWTDKLAIDEQTQRTGMVIQPGLMEKKAMVNMEKAIRGLNLAERLFLSLRKYVSGDLMTSRRL